MVVLTEKEAKKLLESKWRQLKGQWQPLGKRIFSEVVLEKEAKRTQRDTSEKDWH